MGGPVPFHRYDGVGDRQMRLEFRKYTDQERGHGFGRRVFDVKGKFGRTADQPVHVLQPARDRCKAMCLEFGKRDHRVDFVIPRRHGQDVLAARDRLLRRVPGFQLGRGSSHGPIHSGAFPERLLVLHADGTVADPDSSGSRAGTTGQLAHKLGMRGNGVFGRMGGEQVGLQEHGLAGFHHGRQAAKRFERFRQRTAPHRRASRTGIRRQPLCCARPFAQAVRGMGACLPGRSVTHSCYWSNLVTFDMPTTERKTS